MSKYFYSLGLIFFGLVLGQTIKVLVAKGRISKSVPMDKYIKNVQYFVLLGLNPVITIGAFWIVRLDDIRLLAVPMLGISALVFGGVFGLLFSKIFKHEKKKTGSMFVSASFTNLGTIGGLACFTFFGEASYAYVSVYKLFEELYYFPVGYPIAKQFGHCETEDYRKNRLLRVLTDPFILVYLSAVFTGFILNISGVDRPPIYKTVNEILIPVISVLFVTSAGYNMRLGAIGSYMRECLAVAGVKFLITPVIITSIACLIGIGSLYDGLVLKVVLVLSAMPPAFNALIPPQIYNLDTDLANSCWLFCTGAMVLVLPVLYLAQGLL